MSFPCLRAGSLNHFFLNQETFEQTSDEKLLALLPRKTHGQPIFIVMEGD